MSFAPQHIAGHTYHARRGGITNAFRYGVDYVLIDPETGAKGPTLFSRNRWNLASVHDRNHGGTPDAGRGAVWAREVFANHGLSDIDTLLLLTQPRFLGYIFNPVSFWLAFSGDALVAVIAEVNNTFGDRHSYICHRDAFKPIHATDILTSHKVFHVSPFQEIAGDYDFNFDFRDEAINFRIIHRNGTEGLIATLAGPRRAMTNRSLIWAALRRPTGAMRTVFLIYWQALKLKIKGAQYRTRPTPPTEEVT